MGLAAEPGYDAMIPIKRLALSAACIAVCHAWLATAPLRADDVWPTEHSDDKEVPEFTVPTDFDWSQLAVDPTPLFKKPFKLNRKSNAPSDPEMSWKRDDKPDGSSAVTVKQPIVPFWDTRIGADMNVTTQTPLTSSEVLAQKIAHDNHLSQSSGSAWAAMTAPGFGSIWDKTAIEARMDPATDQSKFGTNLTKSLPLGGDDYSLTLQNGYRVTQQTLAPPIGSGAHASRNHEVEQSAKLSVSKTGTSFLAGQTLSTSDEKWLRRVGAEQKIFGGVSVTGTVSETPTGIPNRSLSAGYKYSW